MFHVTLREVVNPRMKFGDSDGGAGECAPDFGVDAAGLRRRHGENWIGLVITIYYREIEREVVDVRIGFVIF